MRPPLHIHATSKQRERLRQMYIQADSPRTRAHVQIVLPSQAKQARPSLFTLTHHPILLASYNAFE